MTDKEFDNILKDALTSRQVPSELNRTLLAKANSRKKAKILKFTRSASAVAAVFICAVAVLSYYNSDTSLKTEEVSLKKDLQTTEKADIDAPVSTTEEKGDTPSPNEEIKKETPDTPFKKRAFDSSAEIAAVQTEVATMEATADTDSAYTPSLSDTPVSDEAEQSDSSDTLAPFSRSGKMAEAVLSNLFNDGYDYKAVIDEKISSQIALLPDASAYTFSGIDGSERFLLSEENRLTVIFESGIVAPPEHGEQFFTVGVLADGKLE